MENSNCSRPFKVKFGGDCSVCGEKIEKGGQACFLNPGKQLIHARCAPSEAEATTTSSSDTTVLPFKAKESSVQVELPAAADQAPASDKEVLFYTRFWSNNSDGEQLRDEALADLKAGKATLDDIPVPMPMPYKCELRPFVCATCKVEETFNTVCASKGGEFVRSQQ